MSDYQDIYLLIREQLDEFDIFEVFDRIESDIQKLNENYNVEHAEALVDLICRVVPNIFSKQVNAMRADRPLFLRTNTFLRHVIGFSLHERVAIEKMFDPLSVVFQVEHDFYTMKGLDNNAIDAEYKSCLEDIPPNFARYKDSPDKRKISVLVLNHLNYFANNGGIDKLINHAALQKASVDYCKRLARFFYLLADYLSKDSKKRYIVRMAEVVFACFLAFGDNDIKQVRKQDVEEMISNMEVLTRSVIQEKGDEMCERFCLEFSLKCFVCPILEKRLNGLVYIEEAVELAKNKATFEDEFMAAHMMIKASRWLTVPYLIKRLKEAQLIQDLFGPQAHPQLIAKAKSIVGLVAYNDALDALDIDMIYNATKDQHLGLATFELLMAVIPQLRGSSVKYVWTKVSQTPLAEFTAQHLQLVVRLARNGASAVDDALDLLWRVVISNDVKQELRTQAMDEFITILKGAKHKRTQYLQTFFRQIIEGQQVLSCLYLARKILEDIPTENDLRDYPLMDMRSAVDGAGRMTRGDVLERLEQDMKLLHAMMTELFLFNDGVSAAVEESWQGKGPFDLQEHLNQIKRRMDMLARLIEWMPRNTLERSLDASFVDLVWRIFYVDVAQKPYASLYNDIVFDWFRRLASATIGKRVGAVLPSNVVLYVFRRWLCALDMTRISVTGFDCFKVVFLCVNWFKGWTRTGTTSLDVEVVDFDSLEGLDSLWTIVLAAGDHDKSADSIAMQSAALLIDLHLKLTREASSKMNTITRAFVDRVMTRLNELRGKLAQGDKSVVSGVDRCISLLLNFLTQFKHNESRLKQLITPPVAQITSPAAATGQSSRLADIQPRTNEQKQLVVQLAEICCVSETVAIMALRRCNYNLDNGLMILMDDAEKIRLLSEAEKFEPKGAPQQPVVPQQPQDSGLITPSFVLSSTDDYFDALFELLQVREVNLTKLWTLLTTIPNNPRKEKALRVLQPPVPWADLLNAKSSPYALLYNLQLIDNVLMAASDNDSPQVAEEKNDWCKAYFLQGGFAWLYHTLKEMFLNEEYFTTTAGQNCLVHTLAILHYFMQVNVKELAANQSEAAKPGTPRTVNRRALTLSFNTKKELSDQIDLADFLNAMLSLIAKIATLSDKTKNDTLTPVIEHAMFMMNSVLASRPDLLQQFYAFKTDKFASIQEFVRYLLLDCPVRPIRLGAAQTFYQLVSKFETNGNKQTPLHFFLGLLLENIPSGNHPTCSEFFSLLGNLLADAAKSQDTSILKNLNFEELIGKVTHEILSRPAEESDRHPDHVVIGYMSLLTALLKERPEFKEKIGSKNSPVQLVSHLFTKCLFFDPSRADSADKTRFIIKFKSSESRNAAYTLLLELANNCMINTFEICLLVLAHQGDTKSYTPPAEVPRKSYTGYVGLKNLGATCYMNSVMQQFFMMPELRRGFFEATAEVKSLANQEDKALVREIGRMFGWLQESDRQYYDPLSFTKSFKVHGEDVNLLTQQDADEFFNLLCDQLERVLQDTKQAKLLHDTFAGSLHQTLVCKEDPSHRSSRAEQDFFTLSLEIQNKNNLDQALDSFFQGEAIQDFHCEKCNKKVEITKRFSLDRPANTMIIHLKRFKFDLFTMQKEKLYDYFQFPMRVNMKKYTRAVIDDGQDTSSVPGEPYEYQLSGVVVHSGSAEMGHYYSFIKERVEGTEQWFRFDDTNVSQFDPNNLALECFGGGQGLMDIDSMNSYSDKNVYMLFYERVNRPKPDVNTQDSNMYIVRQLLKNALPQELQQMIEVDNLSVWGERLRADPGYSKFLVQFFKQLQTTQKGIFVKAHLKSNYDEEESSIRLIKFVTHLVFDGVLKSRGDRQLILDWMAVLKGLYSEHVPACKWLVHTLTADLVHFHSWFEAFLFNSEQVVRETFSELVAQILRTVHPNEVSLFPESYVTEEINLVEGYGGYSNQPSAIFDEAYQERVANSKDSAKETAKDKKDQAPSGAATLQDLFATPTIKSCIDCLLAMMESTRGHWKRFHQYWYLLKEVVLLGHAERRYLYSKQIISAFIEYYMGPFSPFWENRPGKNRVPLGEAGVSSDLTNFMQGFAAAVRACKPAIFVQNPELPLPATSHADSPLLPWSALDRAFLFHREFFASLMKQGYSVDMNAMIVAHLSWEDMQQSAWFISVLFEAFHGSTTNQIPNDLYALQSLLNVNDSLRAWRVALCLNPANGYLHLLCQSGRKSSGLAEFDLLLAFFLELLHSNKKAAGYLFHTAGQWHNNLRKVLADRIKSGEGARTSLTMEQVEAYRVALEAVEKFVTDVPVELDWDLSFDLNDFDIKTIPAH